MDKSRIQLLRYAHHQQKKQIYLQKDKQIYSSLWNYAQNFKLENQQRNFNKILENYDNPYSYVFERNKNYKEVR